MIFTLNEPLRVRLPGLANLTVQEVDSILSVWQRGIVHPQHEAILPAPDLPSPRFLHPHLTNKKPYQV